MVRRTGRKSWVHLPSVPSLFVTKTSNLTTWSSSSIHIWCVILSELVSPWQLNRPNVEEQREHEWAEHWTYGTVSGDTWASEMLEWVMCKVWSFSFLSLLKTYKHKLTLQIINSVPQRRYIAQKTPYCTKRKYHLS